MAVEITTITREKATYQIQQKEMVRTVGNTTEVNAPMASTASLIISAVYVVRWDMEPIIAEREEITAIKCAPQIMTGKQGKLKDPCMRGNRQKDPSELNLGTGYSNLLQINEIRYVIQIPNHFDVRSLQLNNFITMTWIPWSPQSIPKY